ncbi:MAG: alanine--tRNA ligase-related protein [Caenibius sp.]
MTSTNDIRRSFLAFFEANGHEPVPSAPLVPYNDPTLMFVNAGMVPFKNVFTGLETAKFLVLPVRRNACGQGASIMISIMSATPPATTFFEMLGNFSSAIISGTGDHPCLDPADQGMGNLA